VTPRAGESPPVPGYPQRTQTARLTLRRWDDAEAEVYAGLWADPRVAGSALGGRSLDREYALRVFASRQMNWAIHGFGDWAIQDRDTGELIGNVGLGRPGYLPGYERATDVGWLLRPAFWGRGLATEAARAVIDSAFSSLTVDELIAIVAPGNERSVSVARRLGLEREREVSYRHPHHGTQRVSVFAVSRQRWQAARPSSGA
jgi:RimJ/RimL family protein N-acetyltransferase